MEEKLNAIRYELLAFVVCFYRSFIRPSFRPVVVPISLSVLTSLLAPSPFLHPCRPASHLPLSLPPHLCLFLVLSFLPLSPRPSIPRTRPPRTLRPCLFIYSPCLPPPSLTTSHSHPSNVRTNYISLARCVSHWCDFDFLFALTIVLILRLFSET